MTGKLYEGVPIDFSERQKWIGIIGTQNPTTDEYEAAYQFGKRCAHNGLVVVSGLAGGIDTAGHVGCLDGGGMTIAVVSTPSFQKIFPEANIPLAERIKKQGGIVYPYQVKAPYEEKGVKGMTVWQKRFLERDIFVAYMLNQIVAVKELNEPITGGTRWATKHSMQFGKKAFRLGTDEILYSNPEIHDNEKVNPWWELEMNCEDVLNKLCQMRT